MVRIRAATIDDAQAIRDIYEPYVLSTAVSFDLELPSLEYFQAQIPDRLKMYPWLIAEVGDDLVGYAYAGTFHTRQAYRWSVEVSIYLASSHHRRGIGKALYGHLLPLLQQQGFRVAMAGITLPNDASVAIHESFGFQRVAVYPRIGYKLGAWRDVGWWSLDLAPDMQTPSEPIPFAKLPR